ISRENAQTSSVRNVLMRAVGVESAVEVDVIEHVMTDSDTILLCTDGLTNELSDVQIGSVLENINDAQEAADRLVKLADEAGGGDNLTAIVLRQTRKMSGRLLSIGRFGKWLAGI